MNPELSRAAARIMRFINGDKHESFTNLVESAKTLDDIPQPYRDWMQGIHLPGPLPEQMKKLLITKTLPEI